MSFGDEGEGDGEKLALVRDCALFWKDLFCGKDTDDTGEAEADELSAPMGDKVPTTALSEGECGLKREGAKEDCSEIYVCPVGGGTAGGVWGVERKKEEDEESREGWRWR